MRKKIVLELLFLTLTTPVFAEKNHQGPIDPPVSSYLVVNADTGDVLMQKNPREPHAPASLTKMMTLYITMEAIKKGIIRWDQIYTVPRRISLIGGSEAKMWHGEKISVRDLFKAAAVGSANDAASALSEIISGSQDNFVEAMNQKARALGLAHTVYRSPHGLPVPNGAPKDTTTAIDLAKLTLAILRYQPEILQYTGAKETYIRKGKWRFINTNKLIGKYPGMNGLKTGYTDAAGFCLVATAKQRNLSLISIVLGAKTNKERFLYTRQLLDDGFARFQNVLISCKGKRVEVAIPNSTNTFNFGIVKDNLFFMASKDKAPRIKLEVFTPTDIQAPLVRGEKIAEYVARVDGQILARQDIQAEENVEKQGIFRRFFKGFGSSLGPESFTERLEEFVRIMFDMILSDEKNNPKSSPFRVVQQLIKRISSHPSFPYYTISEIFHVLRKVIVEKFEKEGSREKGLDFLYDIYVEALISNHPLSWARYGLGDWLFQEYLQTGKNRTYPQPLPFDEIKKRLAPLKHLDTNFQTELISSRQLQPGQVSLHIGIFPVPGLALAEAMHGVQVYGIDIKGDNSFLAHDVILNLFGHLGQEGFRLPRFFQNDAKDLNTTSGFPQDFADHIDMRALFGGKFSGDPTVIINNILNLLKEGGTILLTDNHLNERASNPTEFALLEMISQESEEWDIEWDIKPLHLLHHYRTHIYLATLKKKTKKETWTELDRTLAAIRQILERYSSVHRGLGQHSQVSTHLFERARFWIGEKFGIDRDTQDVILATSPDLAMEGLAHNLRLSPDDRVISDNAKHWIHTNHTGIPTLANGELDIVELAKFLRTTSTKLVEIENPTRLAITSVNVQTIGQICHQFGAKLVINGSDWSPQEINVKNLDIDFLVFDGNKVSPFAPTVVIADLELLKLRSDEPPYDVGGGVKRLVRKGHVLWLENAEKFEVGSPNIPGTILLASLLRNPDRLPLDKIPDARLKHIEQPQGALSIEKLREHLIGKGIEVPTQTGPKPYVNFDNAASTPTFTPVLSAIRVFLRASAFLKKELLDQAQKSILAYFGASPRKYQHFSFRNTSEAINFLARNPAASRDAIVVNSLLEHNSNELPWRGENQIRLSVNENGFISLRELKALLEAHNPDPTNPKIQLVAISGTSNVLGTVNHLALICELAHRYGAKVFVDAAQLAAHREIDMEVLGIDFLAYSGHKIYAPFGHGGLIARRNLIHKTDERSPPSPEGMIALATMFNILKEIGLEKVAKHEERLIRYALQKFQDFSKTPGVKVRIHGIKDPASVLIKRKTGVIAFDIQIDPEFLPPHLQELPFLPYNLVAAVLAEEGGMGVRAGCFCADLLLQKLLGISDEETEALERMMTAGDRISPPGTTRISFGIYNTEDEINHLFEILGRLAQGKYDLSNYILNEKTGEYYTPEHLAAMETFIDDIDNQIFGPPPITDATTVLLGEKPIPNVRTSELPRGKRILILEHTELDANAYAGNLISPLEKENEIQRLTLTGLSPKKLQESLQGFRPEIVLFPHDRSDLYQAFQDYSTQARQSLTTFSYVSLEAVPFQNLFFPFSDGTADIVKGAIQAHRSQVERTAYDEIFDLSTQVAGAKSKLILDKNAPHAHPFKVAFIQEGQIFPAPPGIQYSIGDQENMSTLVIDPSIPLVAVSPHADDLEIAAGGLVRSLLERVERGSPPRVLNWIFGTGDEWGVQWTPEVQLSPNEETAIKRMIRKQEALEAARVLAKDTEGRIDVQVFSLASAAQHPQSKNPVLPRDHPQVVQDVEFVLAKLEALYKKYEDTLRQGSALTVILPHSEDDHPHHRMSTLLAMEALQRLSHDKGINIQLLFYTAPWAGRFNTYFVSPINWEVPDRSPDRDIQKASIAARVKQSLGLILGELVAGFGKKPLSPDALGGTYAERFMRKTFTPARLIQTPAPLPISRRVLPHQIQPFDQAA